MQATIWQLSKSSRQRAVEGKRVEHKGLTEIDEYATQHGKDKWEKSDRNLLHICQAAATWALDALKHMGRVQDNRCHYCNDGSILSNEHLTCHCSYFDESRYNGDEELRELDLARLPNAIILWLN